MTGIVANDIHSPRARLLLLLKREGAQGIDALAAKLGLSKTATRAHLLRLEREALVMRRTLTTDAPGRPSLEFLLSNAGHGQFPDADAALLTELLNFLKQSDNQPLIDIFFEQLWQRREAELIEITEEPISKLSLADRQAALLQLLERHGFMPEFKEEQGGDTLLLRECHCPFPAAVRATRIPCKLESAFLAKALGRPLLSATWATPPDETVCHFQFGAAKKF